MNESLFSYLEQTHSPDLRFIDPVADRSFSWNQLLEEQPSFVNEKKSLAFLYLDNSVSSIRTLLLFLRSMHTCCLLSAQLPAELKRDLEELYGPHYIFDLERKYPPGKTVFSDGSFRLYKTGKEASPLHPELKILLATSGTTGSPKFVKLTNANFVANTRSILDYLPIAPSDSCILNLPVYYSYGLSILLTNIARGGRIICANETVMMREFWDHFIKYECNSLAGVPYTYEMLIRLGFRGLPEKGLKYMTQAGGKLNEKSLQAILAYCHPKSIPFYVMYGQTEATARMSFLPPSLLPSKMGSIGQPVTNGHFRLDGPHSELVYSGPNVGCGYAETREDLVSCTPLSELFTGDLARCDADNYYYITGRLKRFVKLFGNRINLDDLEQDLKKEFGFMMGCLGMEDKNLLVFSDHDGVPEKKLKDHIHDKFKIHPSVVRFVYINPIPLTNTHKINYQSVAEQYGR